ncbi:U3 small nucleolar RNA-associated protein 4 [Entophlyctis luteolus]|nr:U3 small nucleolar RNA-associated protein 4 [Entophlyctis luteolus]
MCYASSPIPRLACVRANGNIEIWDPVDWVLQRTIPGITGAGSIESIAWVYPKDEIFSDDDDDEDEHQPEQSVKPSTRKPSHSETMEPMLVTAGLDGIVSVWDLEALTPKFSIDSGGGAVWSLAVAPVYGEESSAGAEIAVACEDGVVRLFTISPTLGISFKAACARQDARILSLAYHPTKPLISAGSADSCIRAYSTSTYRLVWHITVDTAVSTAPARRKSKRNGSANVADGEGLGGGTRQDTLVWALAYLPSGTLVAGDSLGVVSFWDDASATLIKALRAHHADVLCLAVGSNQDEPVVFSSGVDRRVLQFRLVENSAAAHIGYMQRVRDRRNQQQDSQSDKTWVLVGDRRFHSHDVRALVLCDEKPVDALVSAGVDSALIVTKSAVRQFSDTKQPQNKRPQLRVGMFPQRPIVSVAEGARLVLARFDSSVKLWRLGQAASLNELEDANVKDGERVGLTKKEKLVAEIKIKVCCMIMFRRQY